jgi:chemotaxis protein MotB
VSAASYADTRPVASNGTVDGKAQNRRIDITIVPDLSALPGFDELNRLESTPR